MTTSLIYPLALKDKPRDSQASNVIHRFTCNCGTSYLGRTQRAISQRIGEHPPRWLLTGDGVRPRSSALPLSAVTRHLMQCGQFDRSAPPFLFLELSAEQGCFHFLEMTHILLENPGLCVQKCTLITLALPWT